MRTTAGCVSVIKSDITLLPFLLLQYLVKVHCYFRMVLCNFYIIWLGYTDFHIRNNKANYQPLQIKKLHVILDLIPSEVDIYLTQVT